MANKKITDLTTAAPVTSDILEFVDVSDTTDSAAGSSRKATLNDLPVSSAVTTALAAKGDASTNTSTSVDSEVAVFSGTGGKTIKRATGSGLAKLTSGVLSVATANTDYATPNQDTTGKSAKTDALNSATTVVNVSAATAPTSGQVLTATSSTAATWQTPSSGGGGGGQTLVTKVVAASGGDYTTLGAALAAASSGWTIWVMPGTYTESALTLSTSGVTVIGSGKDGTTISLSSVAWSIQANNLSFKNLGFQLAGSASLHVESSSQFYEFNSCLFKSTSAISGDLSFGGWGSGQIINCYFQFNPGGGSTIASFNSNVLVTGCFFETMGSIWSGQVWQFSNYCNVVGNFFNSGNVGGTTSAPLVVLASNLTLFTGNNLTGPGGTGGVALQLSQPDNTATGNIFSSFATAIKVNTAASSSIVTSNNVHNCATGITNTSTGSTISNNI